MSASFLDAVIARAASLTIQIEEVPPVVQELIVEATPIHETTPRIEFTPELFELVATQLYGELGDFEKYNDDEYNTHRRSIGETTLAGMHGLTIPTNCIRAIGSLALTSTVGCGVLLKSKGTFHRDRLEAIQLKIDLTENETLLQMKVDWTEQGRPTTSQERTLTRSPCCSSSRIQLW